MFCKQCGKQIDEGNFFCPYCGANQADEAQVRIAQLERMEQRMQKSQPEGQAAQPQYVQPAQPQYGQAQYGGYGQYPQGYNGGYYYGAQPPVQTKPMNGCGLAGLILGILSLVFCSPVFGALLALIGIILSGVGLGRKQKRRSNGLAVAGLVLSILGFLLGIGITFMFIVFLPELYPELYDYMYMYNFILSM